MILPDLVDWNARKYPDKTALVFEGRRYSYAEMKRRIDSLASSLRRLGVSGGDRVAVLAPNCSQLFELYFVVARLGAILVPLNTRLNSNEMLYIMTDATPVALVVEEEFLGVAGDLQGRIPVVKNLIGIGAAPIGYLNYEDLASREASPNPVAVNEDDVSCILYTGGTTGFPKGAMLTHKNLLLNVMNVCIELQLMRDDINLSLSPLFHCASLWAALCLFYLGGTSVIARRFIAEDALKLIQDERVTFCHPVPTMVIEMVEHPNVRRYDVSSLKTIQCTMALPVPAFRTALEVFGNIVVPGYGLTEAGPMVSLMPRRGMVSWARLRDDPSAQVSRYGSAGLELPHVQVRVVDDDGNDVPTGEIGEIVVKSDNVMKGYWNQPEATALAIRDGWLYTGDMVRMDEERFIQFVDRKWGMIKSGGESVYPKEVEDAIMGHPGVQDAAVIGARDHKWTETVKAVVVLKPGYALTDDDIIEHCRKHLASYKKPTSVQFVEALPRNPSGKVAKGELKKKYAGGA